MGFMTEVSILNDRWDEITKNPEAFVNEIYTSSISNGRTPDWITGQTTVAKTHHADDIRVYYAGCNSFFDAFPENSMDMRRLKYHLEYLKEMKRYIKLAEAATKQAIAKGEDNA